MSSLDPHGIHLSEDGLLECEDSNSSEEFIDISSRLGRYRPVFSTYLFRHQLPLSLDEGESRVTEHFTLRPNQEYERFVG